MCRDVSGFGGGGRAVREVHSAVHPLRYASPQIVAAHVGGDADDSAPIFLSGELDVLPNRILVREETPRSLRTENGDARISRSVCLGELAAAQKRDAHQLEITRRNSVHPEKRLGCRRIREIVLEVDGTLLHSSSEGERTNQRGVRDPNKRPNLTNQTPIKIKPPPSHLTKEFFHQDT